MSAPTASIEVLKRSLEANGLPTHGTKVEMLNRLLHNKGDGRKSTAKSTKAAEKMPAMTFPKDEAFKAFAASERSNLIASGITKEDALKEEIDRRWSVLQSLKPPNTPPPTATSKKMEILLNAEQLAELDLIYAGPTKDGMHMYITKPQAPQAAPSAVDAPAAAKKPVKGKASPSSKAASPVKEEVVAASKEPIKRKAEEVDEQEQEQEDEPDMKWACQISTMRLLKKAKKEHLTPLLEDFGVPTKGSMKELSVLLAEQLHYETDDGAEEED